MLKTILIALMAVSAAPYFLFYAKEPTVAVKIIFACLAVLTVAAMVLVYWSHSRAVVVVAAIAALAINAGYWSWAYMAGTKAARKTAYYLEQYHPQSK